jgi:hypothetical protein
MGRRNMSDVAMSIEWVPTDERYLRRRSAGGGGR